MNEIFGQCIYFYARIKYIRYGIILPLQIANCHLVSMQNTHVQYGVWWNGHQQQYWFILIGFAHTVWNISFNENLLCDVQMVTRLGIQTFFPSSNFISIFIIRVNILLLEIEIWNMRRVQWIRKCNVECWKWVSNVHGAIRKGFSVVN